MVKTKAARSSCNYKRANVHSGQGDYYSLTRYDADRARYANFTKGGFLAAAALVAMFVFLSCGVVVFGW